MNTKEQCISFVVSAHSFLLLVSDSVNCPKLLASCCQYRLAVV